MTRHAGIRGQHGIPDSETSHRRQRATSQGLHAAAEDMLREMAFVYHLTRSLKAALLEGAADATART